MPTTSGAPITRQFTLSLLDLPAELRNGIYTDVLAVSTKDAPLCICTPPGLSSRVPIRSLTQVYRQVRAESQPIYYGMNHFWVAKGIERAMAWLRSLERAAVINMYYLNVVEHDTMDLCPGPVTYSLTISNGGRSVDGQQLRCYRCERTDGVEWLASHYPDTDDEAPQRLALSRAIARRVEKQFRELIEFHRAVCGGALLLMDETYAEAR